MISFITWLETKLPEFDPDEAVHSRILLMIRDLAEEGNLKISDLFDYFGPSLIKAIEDLNSNNIFEFFTEEKYEVLEILYKKLYNRWQEIYYLLDELYPRSVNIISRRLDQKNVILQFSRIAHLILQPLVRQAFEMCQ